MVVFRCDASPQIGIGHLMRCRSLAYALHDMGVQCHMIGPSETYKIYKDQQVFMTWLAVEEAFNVNDDAKALVEFAKSVRANTLVLDDYRVDEIYQRILFEAGLHWLQFDGAFQNRLWADWVVNANPLADAEAYSGLIVNPLTKLLTGPQYAILRPEFPPSVFKPDDRPIERVVVTFGGGDDRGGIEFVLNTMLADFMAPLQFIIVSGKSNPRNQGLQNWVTNYGAERIELLVEPDRISDVFANSDLAIMAGGTTVYEAACCRLPMILITIADNQLLQAQALAKQGMALYLGRLETVSAGCLVDAVNHLVKDAKLCSQMRQKAGATVDGRGAYRVAKQLMLESVSIDC